MMKKVIIVGAGPAGLFAALELMDKVEVLVIDKGKNVDERFNDIQGVGGAGGISDGKLNLHPKIGGDLTEFISDKEAYDMIDRVDEIFVKHGAPEEEKLSADELLRRAAASGIEFLPIKQRHIGSDRLPALVNSIKRELEGAGVKFSLQNNVEDVLISENVVKGVVTEKEKIISDYVILAPGRAGSTWLSLVMKKHGIPLKNMPIDIGVRVEVPSSIYEDVVNINWDPKFRMRVPTHDDFVRTFCTSPYGFVVKDTYGKSVGVNGHSMRHKRSNNTNFAFLVKIDLTGPVEDTTAYGYSIAKLATTIGGGNPIIQRLGDLRRGRRSTWNRIKRSYVAPTLTEVTPGDISMALPYRILMDIIEGIDMLDHVIPGVSSDSTLLYAPEIKFSAMRIITKEGFETSIKGLYAVGDGAGVSRGIVSAAATGLIAAEHLIAKL
ncbi:MAG: NAD(P)/FAD-dependent oxidoreductase [Methanocellales archaeon]|nr:NAD(P)/FAD-dependent oxidoreductase [Methanocellales archaeon]